MATTGKPCFICGKPSVLFYDCLVVERASSTRSLGATRSQTTTTEKSRGSRASPYAKIAWGTA